MLKTLITHLDTLEKQIENGEITYEQSLQEYEKCLEELKIAYPGRYESVMNDDGEKTLYSLDFARKEQNGKSA